MRASILASLALAVTVAASPRPAAAARSISVGSPTDGHLVAAVHVAPRPYLRVVPFYADEDVRWGVAELTGLVERAARRVARLHRGAVLSLGDLSRRQGGEVTRHRSHESGRDVDLGYYLRSKGGKPFLADRFVRIDADGNARDIAGVSFDDARNWDLVAALLDDPAAHVSRLFVATHVRARLLAFAARVGVSAEARERAAAVMVEPRGQPHDDHFHVRIACPASQGGACVESREPSASRATTPSPRASTLPQLAPRARAGAAPGSHPRR